MLSEKFHVAGKVSYLFSMSFPTNTPRVFVVEKRQRPFTCRFNLKYTWCICRVLVNPLQRSMFLDIETIQLISSTNQVTGFCKIILAEKRF